MTRALLDHPVLVPPTIPSHQPTAIDLVTIDDTCARLGMTRSALAQMVNAGELAAYVLGGEVRFRRRDVDVLAP